MVSAVAAARFLPAMDAVLQDAMEFLQQQLPDLQHRDLLPELDKIFLEVKY